MEQVNEQARNPYRWLTPEAKRTLANYGITQAAWARMYPNCDRCGCPDDRCIGYHHDENDDTGCDLRYWIEDDIKTGRLHQGAARRSTP